MTSADTAVRLRSVITRPFVQAGAVRHAEGLIHGFLILRTLDGQTIADGDLIQNSRGDRVTTRLVFRFKDGSLQDQTTVYAQRRVFELVSDHLIQKGPSFPKPIDISIDRPAGRVTVRYTDDDGKERVNEEHLDLPPDVSNGIVLTLLKNLEGKAPALTVGMVAPASKPRLVKLAISSLGNEPFRTGGMGRKATHYVVKVEIGGLAVCWRRCWAAAPTRRVDPRARHRRS